MCPLLKKAQYRIYSVIELCMLVAFVTCKYIHHSMCQVKHQRIFVNFTWMHDCPPKFSTLTCTQLMKERQLVKQIIICSAQVINSQSNIHAVLTINSKEKWNTNHSWHQSWDYFNTQALSSGHLHFLFKVDSFNTFALKLITLIWKCQDSEINRLWRSAVKLARTHFYNGINWVPPGRVYAIYFLCTSGIFPLVGSDSHPFICRLPHPSAHLPSL